MFPIATHTQQVPVKYSGVVLGRQQGKVDAEQSVVGHLAAPIRHGPRRITGNWSFKKAKPEQK